MAGFSLSGFWHHLIANFIGNFEQPVLFPSKLSCAQHMRKVLKAFFVGNIIFCATQFHGAQQLWARELINSANLR